MLQMQPITTDLNNINSWRTLDKLIFCSMRFVYLLVQALFKMYFSKATISVGAVWNRRAGAFIIISKDPGFGNGNDHFELHAGPSDWSSFTNCP